MGGNAVKKKESSLFVDSFFPELESTKCEDSVFVHSISPSVLDSVFLELKCLDYSRTKFLLFAGASVLDIH